MIKREINERTAANKNIIESQDNLNIKKKRKYVSSIFRVITKSNVLIFLLGFLTNGFLFLITNTPNSTLSSSASYLRQKELHRELAFTAKQTDEGKFPKNTHRLAIVVPFRDRFDELVIFVPHMSKFLQNKSINFKIYIINQIDSFRFNRAGLINVGFLVSMKECDYMAMHDVDLLPLHYKVDYSYPENNRPYHVTSPGLHPEYNYPTFIGGILLVTKENFLVTNGMSNRYFGWGKEDDDFYLRLQEANISVDRPDLSAFNKNLNKFSFWHNHKPEKRSRDKKRFKKQRRESLMRDSSGVNSVMYRIDSIKELAIENYPCTIINVELFCDKRDTHWCDFDFQFIE